MTAMRSRKEKTPEEKLKEDIDFMRMTVDSVEKEIDFLTTLQVQLKENIEYLKKTNVIALAREYKKAKSDFAKTKERIKILKKDREIYREAYSKLINKSKELKIVATNVVKADFRKKNGQKTNQKKNT